MKRESLLGKWVTDPADTAGALEYGRTAIEFRDDDTALYTIHEVDRDQVMRLTYRLEGDLLVTDQPSSPREETRFAVEGNRLMLWFGGVESRYVRA